MSQQSQDYHPCLPLLEIVLISFSPISATAFGKWSSGNNGVSELKALLLSL